MYGGPLALAPNLAGRAQGGPVRGKLAPATGPGAADVSTDAVELGRAQPEPR